MTLYRVSRWGWLVRQRTEPLSRLSVAVLVVAAFTVLATVVATAARSLWPGPAVGPRRAPAEGQTAIGWAGAPLRTFGTQRPVPIGSVGKVMTAYLILRHHPLADGQDGPTLTVDRAAETDYHSRSGSDQSLLKVEAGDRLTERQAIEALLIPSANNIADLLARWDIGSTTSFVAEMNATAAAMGLHDTHYADPSGFDPGTVSTAVDQTKLAEHAIAIPALISIASLRQVNLPRAGTVQNYNALLGIDGVVGLKTGTTDQAGGNVVFIARHGQRMIVGAVLGQAIGSSTRASLAVAFGISDYLIRKLVGP